MAFTKCTLILAILCFILTLQMEVNGGNQPIMAAAEKEKIDCYGKCTYRCSENPKKDECRIHCVHCCTQCGCVPSGTSGNRQECPCYDTWPDYNGNPLCY